MNQSLFYYLNGFSGKLEWLDTLTFFSAEYLGYWIIGGLITFVVLGRDKRKEIEMLIFAVFSGFVSRIVITEIIRYFYYSPRPFMGGNVYQLIAHTPTSSFPSGHAAFFFALAAAVFFYHKRWSVLFFVVAIVIGVARFVGGIHWPVDILAGAVVGIFSAFLTVPLARYFEYIASYLMKLQKSVR